MHRLCFAVLRLLSDGECHSGERIAQALGVSRGSVSNALRGVDEMGVRVVRTAGLGYRLEPPIEWLDARLIERHAGPGFAVEVADMVDSTSSALMARADREATSGLVLAAEWQIAGRGRRGRAWLGTLGGGLTFSLLRRFEKGAAELSGLSLAVAVALLRALREAGAADVQVKWPNDLLWRGRKLAGILIELKGDALGPTVAVVGVGVNLRLAPQLLESRELQAVDLATATGVRPARSAMLGSVLRHMGAVLQEFEARGLQRLGDEWLAAHAYQDQPVCLVLPGGMEAHGVARGIDAAGALLLRTGRGVRAYSSGEVSLRPGSKRGESHAAGG